jgi:predicted metal-dependent phosphotriesterase family hydrolase
MIHTTGAANVIISSDMGGGFSEQQVRLMLSENPQNLLQH